GRAAAARAARQRCAERELDLGAERDVLRAAQAVEAPSLDPRDAAAPEEEGKAQRLQLRHLPEYRGGGVGAGQGRLVVVMPEDVLDRRSAAWIREADVAEPCAEGGEPADLPGTPDDGELEDLLPDR